MLGSCVQEHMRCTAGHDTWSSPRYLAHVYRVALLVLLFNNCDGQQRAGSIWTASAKRVSASNHEDPDDEEGSPLRGNIATVRRLRRARTQPAQFCHRAAELARNASQVENTTTGAPAATRILAAADYLSGAAVVKSSIRQLGLDGLEGAKGQHGEEGQSANFGRGLVRRRATIGAVGSDAATAAARVLASKQRIRDHVATPDVVVVVPSNDTRASGRDPPCSATAVEHKDRRRVARSGDVDNVDGAPVTPGTRGVLQALYQKSAVTSPSEAAPPQSERSFV
ncbi:unnamed protein product, partial [Amoebophrya sp. A25]|eukprot:GSA25T00025171001.1